MSVTAPAPFGGTLALLGASSAMARDLTLAMAAGPASLQLYVRDLPGAERWLREQGLLGRCALYGYADYGRHAHDAVINFVGASDPRRVVGMGADIFGVTQRHDDLVLDALRRHPRRRYLFLSSGAVYGHSFQQPADEATPASFPVNALAPQDYYAIAKLHAECRHRAAPELDITDLRVFNYFSRHQDLSARFFICDLLRAIRAGSVLHTASDTMLRDYLHPGDFHQLVERVLTAQPGNRVLDCHTLAPVEKSALLEAMGARFGLRYAVAPAGAAAINSTGAKPHYYSLRRGAAALGYVPAWTSLAGLLSEAEAILGRAA